MSWPLGELMPGLERLKRIPAGSPYAITHLG